MLGGLDIKLDEVLKKIMEVSDFNELQEEKSRCLGKQGLVTALMKNIKDIPPDERKKFGRAVNELKSSIEYALEKKRTGSKPFPVRAGLPTSACTARWSPSSIRPGGPTTS